MNTQAQELVTGLVKLSKEFTSSEPGQAAELKRGFKLASKNDLVRTVVYLMEVVGVSDMRVKQLQEDVNGLKEILKLNNINLEEDNAQAAAPNTSGNEGNGADATVGGVQNTAEQTANVESGAVSQEA